MNEFTKDESKILKGIAILFMVGLHLFNRTDTVGYYQPIFYIGNTPIIYYISFLFDACVPIYCFCSGYALYLKNSNIKENMHRVFKLLQRYWIILILTCVAGLFLKNENIPGSIFDFICNATLLRSTYVGAWWFLQTYVLLVLATPLIKKLIDWSKFTIIISLIVYFIAYYFRMMNPIKTDVVIIDIITNALVLFGTSQFPYMVGMLFYKYKIITKIRNTVSDNNFIAFVIVLLCILAHIAIKSMIVAPFIAIVFICGYALFSFNNIIEKILLFFGEHSTNIWLVHFFLSYKFYLSLSKF